MDQDIIEKQATSPIASSLLVIAAVGMLMAMVFGAWEIHELKGEAATPAENARALKSQLLTKSQPIQDWRNAVKEASEKHELSDDDR